MSEQENYEELLPRQPSKGALEWCIKTKFTDEYAIYRDANWRDQLSGQNVNGVSVTCTACGGNWFASKVRGAECSSGFAPFGFWDGGSAIGAGNKFNCPQCGTEVKARHVGEISKYGIDDNRYFMEPWELGKKFVLLGWRAERNIGKDGVKAYRMWPYEAYVFEARKCVRLNGYQKCVTAMTFFDDWRQLKRCEDKWGNTPPESWYKRPGKLTGTTVENSALAEYLKAAGKSAEPVKYLRLWQKHRNVENLIMQGCAELVAEGIDHESNYPYGGKVTLDWIDWKKKRPSAMLGLNKDEYRFCVQEKWNREDLAKYKMVRAWEKVRLPEDWRLIAQHPEYSLSKLCSEKGLLPSTAGGHVKQLWRGNLSILRCLRYLQRRRQGIMLLMDYWEMAARAGLDLRDEHIRLPKNLKREHDRLEQLERIAKSKEEKRRKAKEIEERRPEFEKTVKPLEAWYWEDAGICIRPVRTEQELIDEGATLQHCVGGYGKSVARGDACIFFIRHADRPDESWYTLQVDLKEIREIQNHGLRNCEPTKEVQEFVNRWLDHVRRLRAAGKKTNKKEDAA